MATLTVQTIDRESATPFAPTYAAVGASDKFLPGAQTFLHFKNTNAATRTVTVAAPNNVVPDVGTVDNAYVVPATTGDIMIGPFPAEIFANSADGLCDLTYSGTTNLTVAALKLSQP